MKETTSAVEYREKLQEMSSCHKCKIFVLLKEEKERRGLQDELNPQCAHLFN